MRASELDKRLAQIEAALKPKKPHLHDCLLIEGMEVSAAPGSGRFLIVPPLLGLDEWEAVAAPYQDQITRDALSDIYRSVAAERPKGEMPVYKRQ